MADLRNLASDPAHPKQMRFDDAKANLKVFAGYEAIEGMPQDAIKTLKKWSAKAQPVLDAGKASGFKKQKIDEKLKKAGLEEEYVSYGFLCGFAHNQLTAIISSHGKHQQKYLHEPPYETMVGVLGLALSIAGKAIQRRYAGIGQQSLADGGSIAYCTQRGSDPGEETHWFPRCDLKVDARCRNYPGMHEAGERDLRRATQKRRGSRGFQCLCGALPA